MAKKNNPEQEDEIKDGISQEDGENTEVNTEEAEVIPDENPVEKELAELKDRYLRLAAEYDNFRKRTAKERESLYSMAKGATIEAVLPVYDNLILALAQPTSDEKYKQGIEMTMRKFDQVLEKQGVSAIPAERGDAFDPQKHNAVMHTEDAELGESQISLVFQKGFELDGKVIRHSVVQVAN